MANIVEYILSLRSNQFQSGVTSALGSMDSLNNSVTSFGSAVGIAFGVAGVAMFAKKVIEAGTTVENAQIGLTTLLKSSQEAGEVIKNTMQDATTTPFSFEGLLQANKALISTGESSEQARKDVLNLGNAIASTGGGNDELQRMVVNMQQIRNTGQATALDIKQFAYAGVNIYKVLEEAGIKVVKGNKDSAITYEMLSKALAKAHEKGGIYFNGLENMANATSVQISNLGDAVFVLSNEIFKDFKPEIDSVVSALKNGIVWIKEHRNALYDMGKIALWTYGTFKVLSGVKTMVLTFQALQTGLVAYNATALAAGTATRTLGASMLAVVGPVGWITLAVAGIVSALTLLDNKIDESRAIVAQQVKDDNKAIIVAREYQYEEKFKKSGKSRDQFFKDENKLIDESIKKQDELTKKALYTGGTGGNIQGLTLARTALDNAFNPAKKALDNSGGQAKPAKTEKVTGSKSITINVSIQDLVKELTINTTNIKEGAYKVKEMIEGYLIGAVNDAQITAGQ